MGTNPSLLQEGHKCSNILSTYYVRVMSLLGTQCIQIGISCHRMPSDMLRATSHTRLRAHDYYTSSTLIGGKRRSRSKFASHYAWGTNGVCECRMDVKFTRIPTCNRLDHAFWLLGFFLKPPLGGRPDTKPGDHATLNAHTHWFILCYHVWGPLWIEI